MPSEYLPIFNPDEAACPKCGTRWEKTEYHPNGDICRLQNASPGMTWWVPVTQEHLHFQCQMCGAHWGMSPLDMAERIVLESQKQEGGEQVGPSQLIQWYSTTKPYSVDRTTTTQTEWTQ